LACRIGLPRDLPCHTDSNRHPFSARSSRLDPPSAGDLAVGTTFDVWLKDGSDKLVYNVTALNAPHSITLIGENGAFLCLQCGSTVSFVFVRFPSPSSPMW
jgi:hypothetical protein